MFPLLTQGFLTPQSKISYIYLIKLLAPGMTLFDFPLNSTVNHFSASFLTAVYPEFLSFPLLASSAQQMEKLKYKVMILFKSF